MKIKSVENTGLGYVLGLQIQDDIKSINGKPVRDIIDYQFNIYEDYINLNVLRNGKYYNFRTDKDPEEDLGLEFEDFKYRHCGSKCPFCFVDQNPKGLRKSLYFHDEDFRLSFLHGAYFTLNNVSNTDIDRIISQRLSPLYISVHAVNREIRNFLFGVERDDRLIEKINILVDNNIELHTQIVLCPGINDGDILNETIEALEKFYPGIRSIAIVPIGLTKHRMDLYQFWAVTADYAKKLIPEISKYQRRFLSKFSDRFLYLSDEWYLKAGKGIPSIKHYGELYQLENGVGLTRQFLEDIKFQKKNFPRRMEIPKKISLLTGKLAEPVLNEFVAPELNKIDGLTAEINGVINNFYGPGVDVSGLIAGKDFIDVIKNDKTENDLYLLPPNCLNTDGLTLDDETVESISGKTGKKVYQYNYDFSKVFNLLSAN
ncbi:DUF512 domain-containing protein [candidate division KSB1 bacterium]